MVTGFQEHEKNIIGALAKHEEIISRLYGAYGEKFPDQRDFWIETSKEETEHARLIRELGVNIKNGTVNYIQDKIKILVIQRSIEYINEQLEKARTKEISLINALSIALTIEKSIIDNKFFEAFRGRSVQAKNILKKLQEDVQKHADKIEKMWNENRRYS